MLVISHYGMALSSLKIIIIGGGGGGGDNSRQTDDIFLFLTSDVQCLCHTTPPFHHCFVGNKDLLLQSDRSEITVFL